MQLLVAVKFYRSPSVGKSKKWWKTYDDDDAVHKLCS